MPVTWTYECHPGSALYEVLLDGQARGASDAHIDTEGHQSWVRFRVGRHLEPSEGIDHGAREMVVELMRRPPVDMTDPGQILIHALTNDAANSMHFNVHVLVGAGVSRWQVEYDAEWSRLRVRRLTGRESTNPSA